MAGRSSIQRPLRSSPLCPLLGIELPVVQGALLGATTPEMVAACCDAGALGTVPLGPAPGARENLADAVAGVRMYTDRPFAVNIQVRRGGGALFDPAASGAWLRGTAKLQAMRGVLGPLLDRARGAGAAAGCPPDAADQLGEAGGDAEWDGWAELAEAILAEGVPVVTFGEGLPPPSFTVPLREGGVRLVGTATTPAEGVELEHAGVDAVVARGQEGGGPVGGFLEEPPMGLLALLPLMYAAVSVPIIAAGGIMDWRGAVAALVLGASGVQLGTALLCSYESASPWKQRVLADPPLTALSRAYQGRAVRCVRNAVVRAFAGRGADIPDWPVQAEFTAPLARSSDLDLAEVWAGEGVALCTSRSCRDIVCSLAEGVDAATRAR